MTYTTIQIKSSTRKKLADLKAYGKESYDELINSLIGMIPAGDDEGKYTREFRASILRGLLDIQKGSVSSEDDVRKELGL